MKCNAHIMTQEIGSLVVIRNPFRAPFVVQLSHHDAPSVVVTELCH